MFSSTWKIHGRLLGVGKIVVKTPNVLGYNLPALQEEFLVARTRLEEGLLKKRALFIGRFQPFHNGHLHAVKYILEEFEEVVIVVAAAQYSYTIDNPFTAGERVEMIREGLGELYRRAYVVPVDNVPSNYEWPRHVLSYTPRARVVFSNNRLVKLLFQLYGLETRETPVLEGVSGSLVRKLMATGGDWKSLVPTSVAEVIEEINGVERVKMLWEISPRMPGERFQ